LEKGARVSAFPRSFELIMCEWIERFASKRGPRRGIPIRIEEEVWIAAFAGAARDVMAKEIRLALYVTVLTAIKVHIEQARLG
jgi:hypothetical protein